MATVQARSSDAFVESIGLNAPGFVDTSMRTAAPALIADLGIRYYRSNLQGGSATNGCAALTNLTKTTAMPNGVRFTCGGFFGSVFGANQSGETDANNKSSMLAAINLYNTAVATYPGCLIAVEGVNEPDLIAGAYTIGTSTTFDALEYQQYWFANRSGAASSLPVTSPPLAGENGPDNNLLAVSSWRTSSPNIANAYNIINGHWAYTGNQPEYGGGSNNGFTQFMTTEVAPLQTNARYSWGTQGTYPVWATEGGSQSGPGAWVAVGNTYSAEAVFLPRMFAYLFSLGVDKTFKFDLGAESNNAVWGMSHQVWGDGGDYSAPPYNLTSMKPCYFTIKNMIALLTDPPAAAGVDTFVPGNFTYSLSGATFTGPVGPSSVTSGSNTNVHHIVLGKRNGNFIVVLWQYQTPVPCSTPGTLAPITVTIIPTGMGSYRTAALHTSSNDTDAAWVTQSTWSNATAISGGAVSLSVTDALTMVQFIPNAAPTAAPGSVTASKGTITATEANISWTTATNSPGDYIITVTEVT